MAVQVVRKNGEVLKWLRGALFGGVTYAALAVVPLFPLPLRGVLAAMCAALGALSPAMGVLVLVLSLSVSLAAADLLVGALFLVAGLITLQYFGHRHARAFVAVAATFIAAVFHAEWAIPVLVGFVMGPSAGSSVALVAALVLECAGLLLGAGTLGVTATGGQAAIIVPAAVGRIADPLSFGWLGPAVARIGAEPILRAVGSARDVVMLAVQPLLWAGAAAASGSLTKPDPHARPRPMNVAAVAGVTVGLAAASAAAMAILRGPVAPGALLTGAGVALVLAVAGAVLGEWVFPFLPARSKKAAEAASGSLRAQDADVDELLRVIAAAEEALEERHSEDCFVMITDMKSFTTLTQQHGSVLTAKLIQHHRDLLLPIVFDAGGRGKSTGGDGLVAAFSTAEDALAAAVRMQRALRDDNEGKTAERRVQVRIGIAAGDIIVDRGGCPFIGEGLNLAARVMGLADGGQVLVTHEVIDAATRLPVPVVSHGEFSLKNIAAPVAVEEVLWEDGQQPHRPALDQQPAAA